MPVDYELSADLDSRLAAMLLLEEFTNFATHNVTFKAALKVTVDGESEDLVPCKGSRADLKKVSPLFDLYVNATYVLVFDAYTWLHSNDVYKDAVMHRALMGLQIKVSDSGKVSVVSRPPDICEFRKTVSRYGAWNDDVASFQALLERVVSSSADEFRQAVYSAPVAPAPEQAAEPRRVRAAGRAEVPVGEET